ncbi:hypothetical protein ACM6L3_18425, partial [Paenibacillus larvae]
MNNSIAIERNKIKLPKLGLVRMAKNQEPKGRILNATIRKNSRVRFQSIMKSKSLVNFAYEETIRIT